MFPVSTVASIVLIEEGIVVLKKGIRSTDRLYNHNRLIDAPLFVLRSMPLLKFFNLMLYAAKLFVR